MLLSEISNKLPKLSKTERKVAEYILSNPESILKMEIWKIAALTNTSDASVIRFCRTLGLTGYYQLKVNLANELGSHGININENEDKKGNTNLVFWDIIGRQIATINKNVKTEAIQKTCEFLLKAKTVYMSAWGNTTAIGADLAHRLTYFGISAFTTELPEYLMRNLANAQQNDLLIAISHSGSSTAVIDTLKFAKQKKLNTVLIGNESSSPAAHAADLLLCADADNFLFHDVGAGSHLIEMIIVDLVLYHLSRIKSPGEYSEEAESLLSRYKV